MYSQHATACWVALTSNDRFVILDTLAKLSKSEAIWSDLRGAKIQCKPPTDSRCHLGVVVRFWGGMPSTD